MTEQLMTVDQVAERLQVAPKTVRRWLTAGQLEGGKAGRQWRVSEAALRGYLQRKAGKGPQ